MCRLTAFLDTGALSIARAQSGPVRHLLVRWKRRHFRARLSQDAGCCQLSDSRNSLQQQERIVEWLCVHSPQYLAVQFFQFFPQTSQV
jgi:hypothetical protein